MRTKQQAKIRPNVHTTCGSDGVERALPLVHAGVDTIVPNEQQQRNVQHGVSPNVLGQPILTSIELNQPVHRAPECPTIRSNMCLKRKADESSMSAEVCCRKRFASTGHLLAQNSGSEELSLGDANVGCSMNVPSVPSVAEELQQPYLALSRGAVVLDFATGTASKHDVNDAQVQHSGQEVRGNSQCTRYTTAQKGKRRMEEHLSDLCCLNKQSKRQRRQVSLADDEGLTSAYQGSLAMEASASVGAYIWYESFRGGRRGRGRLRMRSHAQGAASEFTQTVPPVRSGPPAEYASLRPCNCICSHCHASFWYEERLKGSTCRSGPLYHRCCHGGKVQLFNPDDYPQDIKNLFSDPHFMKNIRAYNQMFAMTSLGANVDETVNTGRGPCNTP